MISRVGPQVYPTVRTTNYSNHQASGVAPRLLTSRDINDLLVTLQRQIPGTHRTEGPAYMIPSQDRHLISDASVMAAVAAMAPLGTYHRSIIDAKSYSTQEEKNAGVVDYTLAA